MVKFFKMQGIGNDYIFIDNMEGKNNIKKIKPFVRAICQRHYGVGADGVILLQKSKAADVKIKIYNSDASLANMCGNASRCVAYYIHKKIGKDVVKIQTQNRTITCKMMSTFKDGAKVRVDMGSAFLDKILIVQFEEKEFTLNVVDIGNRHCVIFVDNFNFNVRKFCKYIQNLPIFDDGINVELVQVKKDHIKVKVYERGSGFTLACGSGACACAFVCYLKSYTQNYVNVKLDGGELNIECKEHIIMTGECRYVYDGVWYEY